MRVPRRSHPSRPQPYWVLCAGCGKTVVVEVAPPERKKVLYLECFNKK